MNRVVLIGVLACPVELRELSMGRTIGKTIIAVSRGADVGTYWIGLTLWDRQAINAARYLGQGSQVAVQGRLHGAYRTTWAADGTRGSRRTVDVVVDRITYLSPRPPAGGRGGRP